MWRNPVWLLALGVGCPLRKGASVPSKARAASLESPESVEARRQADAGEGRRLTSVADPMAGSMPRLRSIRVVPRFDATSRDSK